MITDDVLASARVLWDYHLMHQHPGPSDCILVLGSHDTRVAERGAALYLQGLAPLLVMSGGLGRLTKESWTETESARFARIAMEMGVPGDAILVEDKSTNTGENIRFTQKLLEEKGLHPQRFIVVQKPYMERRTYATFKKQWPGKNFTVTSPLLSFENYPTGEMPLEKVISIMTGDLQRIRMYPAKGFQVYQYIPPEVAAAYEKLVAAGFTQQLVNEEI
jgi:uncharacterized SAM-binding protein YcdF (DUF218 family)